MLMLHDRVNDMDKYNEILRVFIESIVDCHVPIDVGSKIQRIPFYVAMMMGDQAQRETYARVLLAISCDGLGDDISKRISNTNAIYFNEDMCTRIL